jgi:uncharacterized protein YjbI with pentapeptide repeats
MQTQRRYNLKGGKNLRWSKFNRLRLHVLQFNRRKFDGPPLNQCQFNKLQFNEWQLNGANLTNMNLKKDSLIDPNLRRA